MSGFRAGTAGAAFSQTELLAEAIVPLLNPNRPPHKARGLAPKLSFYNLTNMVHTTLVIS